MLFDFKLIFVWYVFILGVILIFRSNKYLYCVDIGYFGLLMLKKFFLMLMYICIYFEIWII